MTAWMKGFLSVAMALALTVFCSAADPAAVDSKATPATPISVVINQDIAFPIQNQIGFYLAGGTQLTLQSNVSTGGYGIVGGFFGTSRVSSIPSISAPCVYVSDAASNDIASISLQSQQVVGNFSGSQTDDGSANGIGLAVNQNYLYASFTASKTIGTFGLQSGCGLTFLGDVSATGLQGGSVTGMAVNGKILVVAYGDGSIQSFNITGGMPVSNNDLKNSNGYISGNLNLPSGVDITQDGRFAIFGDISTSTVVEVSYIGTGKLWGTSVYTAGTGDNSAAIRLSPDQSLLYIANSEGGSVTAAFFNKATGRVSPGCASPLTGFNGRPWLGSVVTRDTTGTGNVLYVAEFGRDYLEINHGPSSAIGVLTITSNGKTCTLTEATGSPQLTSFPGTLSIGVYPPRPF
jgi:6-phosphogluconolactonase (cycloisomerase 2 family)